MMVPRRPSAGRRSTERRSRRTLNDLTSDFFFSGPDSTLFANQNAATAWPNHPKGFSTSQIAASRTSVRYSMNQLESQRNLHRNLHSSLSRSAQVDVKQQLGKVEAAGVEPVCVGQESYSHAVPRGSLPPKHPLSGPSTCTETCTVWGRLRAILRGHARHHADTLTEHPQGGV